MNLSLPAGLVAGLSAFAAASAAQAAAPADVTVRVEGATRTLVDATRVATSAQPVAKDGRDCSGTSAGGALDQATAGNWTAKYFEGLGLFVQAIAGEDHSTPPDFWVAWLNHRSLTQGVCDTELQQGDELLFFVDHCEVDQATQNCIDPVLPLGLTAPTAATQGAGTPVSVVRYEPDGTPTPVAGARVTGLGVDAVTGADGHATVTFAQPGTVAIRAELPGSARSETHQVTVAAAARSAAPAPLPRP